ncbi:hypothetical protein C3Z09_22320 [Lelliottia aquatilis]|nr:hypothetical protein C3Z09_22320 [Lelliottia aquatilis]
MASDAATIELDKNWVSLTNGTQTATLQVFHDAVRVVPSVAEPAADDEGFILEPGVWKVTPPTVAWIRAQNTSSRIVVLLE